MANPNEDFSPSLISILVVDYEACFLQNLAAMLKQHAYEVTVTEKAANALSMIKENPDQFQLVLVNITIKDVDIQLFAEQLQKTKTRFLLICPNKGYKSVVGCSFYLERPISFDELKYLWQHAYRRNINPTRKSKTEHEKYSDEFWIESPQDQKLKTTYEKKSDEFRVKSPEDRKPKITHEKTSNEFSGENPQDSKGKRKLTSDEFCVQNPQDRKEKKKLIIFKGESSKTHKYKLKFDNKTDDDDEELPRNLKSSKNRICWTPKLHGKFLAAINTLGEKYARPKAICMIMNVRNLSQRQVASHLQKYKKQLNGTYYTKRQQPWNSSASLEYIPRQYPFNEAGSSRNGNIYLEPTLPPSVQQYGVSTQPRWSLEYNSMVQNYSNYPLPVISDYSCYREQTPFSTTQDTEVDQHVPPRTSGSAVENFIHYPDSSNRGDRIPFLDSSGTVIQQFVHVRQYLQGNNMVPMFLNNEPVQRSTFANFNGGNHITFPIQPDTLVQHVLSFGHNSMVESFANGQTTSELLNGGSYWMPSDSTFQSFPNDLNRGDQLSFSTPPRTLAPQSPVPVGNYVSTVGNSSTFQRYSSSQIDNFNRGDQTPFWNSPSTFASLSAPAETYGVSLGENSTFQTNPNYPTVTDNVSVVDQTLFPNGQAGSVSYSAGYIPHDVSNRLVPEANFTDSYQDSGNQTPDELLNMLKQDSKMDG